MSASSLFKTVGKFMSKNSPTILTYLSVAGLGTTVFMAVKATPRALEILEMENEYREADDDDTEITKMEVVKLTYKEYIPAVIMGGVTIACIVGANTINLKRNAALATVYSLTETTLKEYRSKVVEKIGEAKEREIHDEVAKDKILKNPVTENKIMITGRGDTLCYDAFSGRYFKSDRESLRAVENELNRELLVNDFISLNEVYDLMGLADIKYGHEIGWRTRDLDEGMISFKFSSILTKEGVPCLNVDYYIEPNCRYMDDFDIV